MGSISKPSTFLRYSLLTKKGDDFIPAQNHLSIKIDDELDDILTTLAAKKHMNKSELVRKLILTSLDKELARDSVDYIREQIHEEIKATCFPQFERIAKLEAKIGYQSVSNFYLLAHIMSSILPSDKRKHFNEILQKSKAMAVSYMQLQPSDFRDVMRAEDNALEKLDL